MFRIIFLFVVLGAGLFVGTQFSGQQGYVLISIANKTIEMSVTTLVIFLIAALAALFFLEFVVKKFLSASSTTWNWFSVRKLKRSRRYTNEGIIKLMEGDWKAAEKKVTRWANHHDMPLLCYLAAAEAAFGQGNKEKRDHYLQLASEQDNADLAVQLTRAKQAVREEDFELALSVLTTLKAHYSSNSIVLSLLKTTLVQLKDWDALLDLLPKLKKAKLIDHLELEQLEQQAQCGQMKSIAEAQGSEGLIAHWDKLPRKVRQDNHLITCFTKQLIARKADHEAFTIVKEALKKSASDELYQLIAEMNLSDVHPAITLLQKSTSKDPSNAAAHSALAQLHLREQQWSDAQIHFEKALEIRSSLSDYAYLADTLEKQDLIKAANEVSRKALTLIDK